LPVLDASHFRELSEPELALRTDDELIDYIRGARAARRLPTATLALRILVFGYWDTLVARAGLKLPRSAAEDVAATALESAIKSAFDGESVGEFRSWMHTVLARRISDYYRSREGKPKLVPLISENAGDEELWGEEPSVGAPDGGVVDLRKAIEQAYGELAPSHQAVVDLYVFSEYSAAETTAQTTESENNVHQIGSRFRKRVKGILGP
ncbi:MAG: hypothetical protein WKF29_04490, partial [Thermoleophilaceae bacterium]